VTRPFSLDLSLILALLVLAACGESPTPTSPETVGDPAPAREQPGLLTSGLGSWTTRAPMPTARSNLAAAVVYTVSGQPVLYAIGGLDGLPTVLRRVEAYNFATNTWTQKAGLPSARAQTNGANVIGGKIYLSGGDNSTGAASSSLYVYDPGTNAWTTKASMPVKTSSGLSGVINGKLYVVVGFCENCSNHFPHRLYRYDPSSNSWTRRADSPRQHIYGAANVIDGKLYVVGGDDGSFDTRSATNWVDAYDPATNTWSPKAPFPGPRTGAGAAVLAKKLYLIGGNTGEDDVAAMDAYDPATNTWAGKAPMKTARSGLVARTVTYGGVSYILAVGGSPPNGEGPTGTLERYTP
jgi:N-acetylneuraminic acid mutarotase